MTLKSSERLSVIRNIVMSSFEGNNKHLVSTKKVDKKKGGF